MKQISVGTRGSELAIKQAKIALGALREAAADCKYHIRRISTRGDRVREVPLHDVGGSGVFTREIECQLVAGEIDIAGHSLKDLPTRMDERLQIGAVLPRANPSDVLVSDDGATFEQLPPGARIGTGSARRKAQLLFHREDLRVVPLRGNVDTRLKKVNGDQYDAVVLAAAGLIRMGRQEEISEYLDEDDFIPAPGQGAIALQIRRDDYQIRQRVRLVNDPDTELVVTAERALLHHLGASCREPIAAHARRKNHHLLLHGMVADPAGRRYITVEVGLEAENMTVEAARELGREAADELLRRGGDKILRDLRS